MESSGRSAKVVPAGIVIPFILVTLLFPLWGFANDITNPMVKAFSKILMMSNFQGSLVQFAFYGGYFAMAFPAAMFIKRDMGSPLHCRRLPFSGGPIIVGRNRSHVKHVLIRCRSTGETRADADAVSLG